MKDIFIFSLKILKFKIENKFKMNKAIFLMVLLSTSHNSKCSFGFYLMIK